MVVVKFSNRVQCVSRSLDGNISGWIPDSSVMTIKELRKITHSTYYDLVLADDTVVFSYPAQHIQVLEGSITRQ